MKKIINGKTYNTDTARKLAVADEGELYEKKNGEFFIHINIKEIGLEMIHPVDKKQAQFWADKIAEEYTPFG